MCRRPWRFRPHRLDLAGNVGVCRGLDSPDGVPGGHGLRGAAADIVEDRIHRAFADRRITGIDTAHAGLRGERNKRRGQLLHVAAADAVFLLCQHHDRTALRRFVRERRQLGRIRQFLLGDAADGTEFRRLPVAERNGAGLVEQQRVDVTGGFDRAAGHRQHVEAHQPVHAGDADRRQQRADGRRNQRHEQRHQHDH